MVFDRYARFYDVLYRDKDYAAECRYLERLFERLGPRRVRSVLDLGCGTGGHALLLAAKGFEVTGVDLSPGMLAEARLKAREAGAAVRFLKGDVRSVRIGETFDAVVAMFAVMGYQTEDRDLSRALATAAAHLKAGGLFVADLWYGPAVLHDPPGDRVKRVRDGEDSVERNTTCRINHLRQVVDVRFRTVRRRGGRVVERSDETHPMRYFFPRELDLLLEGAGLERVLIAPFMRLRGIPGSRDWNVTVAAKRKRTSSGKMDT